MNRDAQKDLAISLGQTIYTNTINDLRRQLAELKANSQAREARLREALIAAKYATKPSITLDMIEAALSTPPDDTALREMIERSGEVMRERCAKFVKQNLYSNQTDIDAIRAIPGVTLEDLK